MPISTKTSQKDPPALSPQWLYDTLMEVIESDLTSENILKLDDTYKNESNEDREVRMERYEWAFALLDECLLDIQEDMKNDALTIQHAMKLVAARESDDQDAKTMEEIEEDLANSDFRA